MSDLFEVVITAPDPDWLVEMTRRRGSPADDPDVSVAELGCEGGVGDQHGEPVLFPNGHRE
jgi:hypothetical protein